MTHMQRFSLPMESAIDLIFQYKDCYEYAYIPTVYDVKIVKSIGLKREDICIAVEYERCELFNNNASLVAKQIGQRIYFVHIGKCMPEIGVKYDEKVDLVYDSKYHVVVWGKKIKEQHFFYGESQINKPVFIEIEDEPQRVGIGIEYFTREYLTGNSSVQVQEIVRMCEVVSLD